MEREVTRGGGRVPQVLGFSVQVVVVLVLVLVWVEITTSVVVLMTETVVG